jgi:hypothetical protein
MIRRFAALGLVFLGACSASHGRNIGEGNASVQAPKRRREILASVEGRSGLFRLSCRKAGRAGLGRAFCIWEMGTRARVSFQVARRRRRARAVPRLQVSLDATGKGQGVLFVPENGRDMLRTPALTQAER